MYNEISLDIETLDNTPTSVVVSIGAVKFNLHSEESFDDIMKDEDRHFYTTLKLQPQIDLGRTVGGSTVSWWMKQTNAARAVFDAPGPESNVQALQDFANFCKTATRIWGNGNMFDNVIIRDLFIDYALPYPVEFWNDMDLRTLKLASGLADKPPIVGNTNMVAHNALDDAAYQAFCAQFYWGVIHGNGEDK